MTIRTKYSIGATHAPPLGAITAARRKSVMSQPKKPPIRAGLMTIANQGATCVSNVMGFQ